MSLAASFWKYRSAEPLAMAAAAGGDADATITGAADDAPPADAPRTTAETRADGQAGDWPTFQARFLAVFRLLHPLHMLLLAGRK